VTGDRHADPAGDQDFERRLRQRLHEAADAAPEFSTASLGAARRQDAQRQPIGRRRNRWPVLAVAAALLIVVMTGGGLWIWLSPTSGGGTGGGAVGSGAGASCAEVLSRNHHTYQPYDTVRVPREGRKLGRAYWCQDTQPASARPSEVVHAMPGVPAGDGFLLNGRIWLRTDLEGMPTAIHGLQRPVGCLRPTTLSGRIEQFDGHTAGVSTKVRAPYTLGVRVDRGLGRIGMRAYDNVRVTVRVTAGTRHADAIAKLAQRGEPGQTVRIELVCHRQAFVATAVRAK
jgi:hypothetical protein